MKIALFGKMRSGKDTVGEMLINDYNFKRFAFGEGIGQIIEEYFPEVLMEGKKPRHHYQFIGQQLRQLDEDVWIKYLLKSIAEYEQESEESVRVVITDGRQSNEAVKLKEQGFVIVKVEAPDKVRMERIIQAGDQFTPELFQHETELQVDQINPDYIITNDKDLKHLDRQIATLLLKIKAEQLGIPFEIILISLLAFYSRNEGDSVD